jgi:2-(1,2-epoxy-1,2-dihydrophenyl)acetyl-CoA isomerase
MSPDDTGIRVEPDGDVLRLVIARPEVRNALTDAALDVLADAVAVATTDDTTRVIAITAEGQHFCAGIDLPSVNVAPSRRPRTGHVQRRLGTGAHRFVRAMWECQLQVVASVRGHAAGVGCNIALAADFVVASRTARFSEPFVARALTPDSGGTFLLPRLIGVARAKELLLLGEAIDATRAYDWGLVTRLVDDDDLETAAAALVTRLASAPTVAVGLTKSLVHGSLEASLDQALEHEAMAEELAVRSPDFKEGLQAFVAKRPPEFGGR